MKISIKELQRYDAIEKVVIESVDLSLYIARVLVRDEEYLLADATGGTLKTRNLLDMKEQLAGLPISEMALVQRSAYDEMVGHASEPVDNAMEVSLSPELYPTPKWLQ